MGLTRTEHCAGSSANTTQDLHTPHTALAVVQIKHTAHCAGSSANTTQDLHTQHTALAVVQKIANKIIIRGLVVAPTRQTALAVH